ncbi:MAG: hypothetical protein OJF61_002629 [Rhodanobacteraceae bacterium]|nr:MAG: hypothetical protein OJF61_002629 [Rhodanobacteraceae bacterium]
MSAGWRDGASLIQAFEFFHPWAYGESHPPHSPFPWKGEEKLTPFGTKGVGAKRRWDDQE